MGPLDAQALEVEAAEAALNAAESRVAARRRDVLAAGQAVRTAWGRILAARPEDRTTLWQTDYEERRLAQRVAEDWLSAEMRARNELQRRFDQAREQLLRMEQSELRNHRRIPLYDGQQRKYV